MTDTLANNPLLNPPALPNNAPALDQFKVEYVLPALKAAIDEARAEIFAIKRNPEAPTFKNTIEALEFSGAKAHRVTLVFSNIALANADDAIRAIEAEVDIENTRFGNDIMMDAELFARVKAVYDQRASLSLSPVEARLLENSYKGFARSGALLDDAGKDELRKINERLAELATQFNQNEVLSTDAYSRATAEGELAGLPQRAKDMYREMAREAGMDADKWLIKLSPPPSDILAYAENRALREEMYRAQFDVAYGGAHDNRPLILEIVKLRQREAELLGYRNYAHFVLDERMAKTPEAVMQFLDGNARIYRPAAEAHLEKVKAFAKAKDGLEDFKPWDYGYYNRWLKEETFSLKLEELRPYFRLEAVMEGLRMHAEKLFNISMKPQAPGKYPVYHQDVIVYEVNDKDSGELLGVFYGDYYARSGAKSGGAWAYSFQGRGEEGGVDKIPLVINVCNFAKPTPETPSLLSYDDVTTVFHEFGHAMHNLLARGRYGSLNGTAVRRDFVELPSQVQENWVKEKEVLDTFAKHYKTGEPMPAELIRKLNDVENFGAGYVGLRQTFLAMLDMAWHSTDPAKIESVEAMEDSIIAKASLFPRAAGTMSTAFGHIFAGGYSAGYYGYKWAEVLDADVFDAFKKKGLYDKELAHLLRKTIYETGNNEEPGILFRKMMGRDPDPNAMFLREGLEIIERKMAG